MSSTIRTLVTTLTLAATVSFPAAMADTTTPLSVAPPPIIMPQSPSIPVKSYVLTDDEGYVLASKNPHEKLAPASLTKLMTLYVIFDALKTGQINITDKVHISNKAWRTGGSRMFLKPGTSVPVQLLIEGIIVDSGNDACVAMAEDIAGSTDGFVSLMNAHAQRLGMNDTHYDNVTGLPHPGHVSSAHDLALLARTIHNTFPEYYHDFSQKWFTYNKIKQSNRNRLLWRDSHVDGMKTGHTDSAGYCLVASEEKNSMRLFSVVMGAKTDTARANTSQQLLNFGYHFFEKHTLFKANDTLASPRIWQAQSKTTPMGVTQAFNVVIPRGHYRDLQANVTFTNPHLKAPIKQGATYGKVTVTLNGKVKKEAPLVALQKNDVGSMWQRTRDWALGFFDHSDTQSATTQQG